MTEITGLEGLSELRELYLSHNGITKLAGVNHLVGTDSEDTIPSVLENLHNLSCLV